MTAKNEFTEIDRIIDEADEIHLVKSLDELPEQFTPVMKRIANAHIRLNGYYTCQMDGRKIFVAPDDDAGTIN